MKMLVGLVALTMLLMLWAPSAMPQIISTSLPSVEIGTKEKSPVSAHIMVSPIGMWDYKEVWLGPTFIDEYGDSYTPIGTIGQATYAQILLAGEIAIPLGSSRWALALGGWYNRLGEADYDFDGQIYYESDMYDPMLFPFTASIPISISILEGHAGLYYRGFGFQIGVVRTGASSDGDFNDATIDDISIGDIPELAPFETSTVDWTYYGVYRRAGQRWGFSVGLGAYAKKGITEDAPLRFGEDEMVGSGFLTANVLLGKGFTLDGSFWFIGATDAVEDFEGLTSETPSDAQSRLMVGLGYNF